MAKTLRTILSLDVSGFHAGLRRAMKGVRRFDREIGRPMMKFARNATIAATAVGAIGVAFARMGMKAAGSFEMLRLRLSNMSSSAEDFKKQWSAAMRVFLTSPMELDETVEATTLLAAFGVKGEKALRAVGSASVMLGRNVLDIVRAVGSLETESFRKMGITVSNDLGSTGKVMFHMLDRAGNSVTKIANGVDEARKLAIEFMNVKFGGALEKASKTLEGAMSTFRGVKKFALAELFEPFRARAVPIIMKLNKELIRLSLSGTFRRFGERVARSVEDMMTKVRKFIFTIRWMWNNSHDIAKKMVIIFTGLAVSYKTGFAGPMVKASIMVGRAITSSMMAPFRKIILVVAAVITSFNTLKSLIQALGGEKILEGIRQGIAGFLEGLGAMGQMLKATVLDPFMQGISDTLDFFKGGWESFVQTDFAKKFTQSWKDNWKDTFSMLNKLTMGALDFIVPGDMKKWLEELGKIKDVRLPQVDPQLADFEQAVYRGVTSAIERNRRRMPVDAKRRSEAQKQFDKIRNDTLKRIERGGAQMSKTLERMLEQGALVF